MTIILIIIGYMLGSIPFGLLVAKFAGFGDIRNFGSGNIGATNVVRKAGKFYGLLTLLGDGGKGALAVYLAQRFATPDTAIYAGCAAIIGHVFPVWLGFKGGKAVATSFAVWLMLDLQLGLLVIAAWLMTFALFRLSSLAALVAFIFAPFIVYLTHQETPFIICSTLISILVLYRHKDNIKRLISGQEK